MRPLPVALALLATTFAGCLVETPGEPVPTQDPKALADWALRALPHDPDHLHNLSAHHEGLTTPNFELVGWTPVTRSGSATMGGLGCGAVNAAPGRKIAVATVGWDNTGGLAVTDVTDPSKPEKVGEITSSQFWFRDADITPNGKWAVVASFPNPPVDVPVIGADGKEDGACPTAAPPAAMAAAGGIGLVNLADPSNPRIVDFSPDPESGPHSVYATTIDGVHYGIAAIGGLPSDTGRFWFFTWTDAGQLQTYGVHHLQAPRMQTQQPLFNLHTDAWIQKHPKTGQLLAYVANWDSGLVILRMDGPGRLIPVGSWNNYDPAQGSEMTGQVHSVEVTPELWDGTHYTFIGQELISRPKNRPSGQVIMLDTTDPAKPVPVGRWTLPVDTGPWDKKVMWCCLFSTHYLELVERTLYVAMYHGGVWAIDADPKSGPEMPSLGVFLPTPPDKGYESPNPGGPAPLVMEVYSVDGHTLATFDEHGGLYTFRFHPETKVPIPAPWTADAWIKR